MKFIMVIIICFGADCRAIFEKFDYQTYDQCISEAIVVTEYMKQTFPTSSGQIHCWDESQFNEFKKGLENGMPVAPIRDKPMISA